ncbi:MAG: hypothetical protein LBB80_03150 [Treponema sp.]|jgi:hypothetical protein|nr:hypothetical protein [Treponema sp.]
MGYTDKTVFSFSIKDKAAYRKITDAFKKQRKGATVADIAAQTALPLNTIRELVPVAADEYSGRLEVTESGEILYSFPQGFTSKYRGFRAGLRKFTDKVLEGMKIAGTLLFKVWIMVMLVGYFVLFMLIALAALAVSVASNSSNSDNRSEGRGGGGLFLAGSIFDLIIRIWFYSELTKAVDRSFNGRYYTGENSRPKGKPLYKAIFSFIFGDGDPNGDWTAKEKQAIIAYIQANQGVISLPEYMVLTGCTPTEAEQGLSACCVEFSGLPEVTEEGTLVYRFDELLLRADRRDRSFGGSSPVKRLKHFSSNPTKMNLWFSVINGVNLIFGGYFLFNALSTGPLTTQAQFDAASYLYKITYALSEVVVDNPLPLIVVGLGVVPLIFSLLFWFIPSLRYFFTKQENETIKLDNLRKIGYGVMWSRPQGITVNDIKADRPECQPKNLSAAQNQVIKEMGSYSIPEVGLDTGGNPNYTFPELEREKQALSKYRASINPEASSLGSTVFDSNA